MGARNEEESSEEGESDEEGIESELLDSDEDEIDEEGQQYLESLQEKVNKASGAPFKVKGKALTEIVKLAEQRMAARESKKIEAAGGYQFAQQTVPGGFNFGAPVTSPFGK